MDDPTRLTRTIPLAGRRVTVSAPAGDYALSHYNGRAFRDFDRFCRRHLRPADVMLDVGANIGLSSLVAAPLLPQGRILAVEGSSRNAAALRDNFARHGLDPGTVVHAAAGATAGTVPFFESSAFGHVVLDTAMDVPDGTATPLRTLDEIVETHALPRVDFIKIDIEGYEQEALTGARETLARCDPLVFLEFNSWCLVAAYDRSPRGFLDWLLATFPQLYLWRRGRLVSVREIGSRQFLERHMTRHRCIDNLVAATASDRLRPDPVEQPRPWWHLGAAAAAWRHRLGLG